MSTLGDADSAAQTTLHLAQMHDPGDAHDLQHAVPVGRLPKHIISLRAPRIAASTPTTQNTHKNKNHGNMSSGGSNNALSRLCLKENAPRAFRAVNEPENVKDDDSLHSRHLNHLPVHLQFNFPVQITTLTAATLHHLSQSHFQVDTLIVQTVAGKNTVKPDCPSF